MLFARPFVSSRRLDGLRRCLILQQLTPRELRRFGVECQFRDYAAGESLVEQDTLGTELHLLIEGLVDITVRGREGAEVKVSEVRKGDVLGEASIFSDLPRTASAVARIPCHVAVIPRDSLFAFCDANPRAGLKIFAFVIFSLLKRLQSTSRELADAREAGITREDLDRLHEHMPKSLGDMLGQAARWEE